MSGAWTARLKFLYNSGLPNIYGRLLHPAGKVLAISWAVSKHFRFVVAPCWVEDSLMSGFTLQK